MFSTSSPWSLKEHHELQAALWLAHSQKSLQAGHVLEVRYLEMSVNKLQGCCIEFRCVDGLPAKIERLSQHTLLHQNRPSKASEAAFL